MSESSAHSKSCPACGAVLAAEAAEGLCSKCLMEGEMRPTLVSDSAKPRRPAVFAVEELAGYFPAYEILRMLGRGGMGAVYLARQLSLNRLVAIKVLPEDMSRGDADFAVRFKNEAQAMARLNHPGIVGVYDFGQTANGLLFIVMEYVDGTDVQLMLASQGRLHSGQAMAITAHVCDALQYAHTRGIIHRDIKPSNIMVSHDGVVKVADFGLAKMSHVQTTGLTQSGMALGTMHFMAPEVLMAGTAVDQRADIYAVGVMLYQMLTGKFPQGMFEMPSFQVPGLDPRYDRIVARALRHDPELRYQAVLELRNDLDAILTQPVEKAGPEAGEVAALPKAEMRAKKGPAYVLPRPELENGGGAAAQVPARKSSAWVPLLFMAVAATVAAGWVIFGRNRPPNGGAGGPDTAHAMTTKKMAEASAGHPFENSLGMRFVPVPIVGGPTDGERVLFSIWETRTEDYEAFVKAAGQTWPISAVSLRTAGYPATDIDWPHAQAFCAWLTQREQQEGHIGPNEEYRLPSDHEWSCATGIGAQEKAEELPGTKNLNPPAVLYSWGNSWPPPAGAGNYSGEECANDKVFSTQQIIEGYCDGFPHTAPVGSFPANKLGLYDMGGNVFEWCEDFVDKHRITRVRRGGSYVNGRRDNLRWSHRAHTQPQMQGNDYGLRVVLAPKRVSAPATKPEK